MDWEKWKAALLQEVEPIFKQWQEGAITDQELAMKHAIIASEILTLLGIFQERADK